MTKIFVTGITGYIGGDAIYTIAAAHPEYELTCLVRNSDKGAQVAKEYPAVRLVYDDLDSTELLEEEARKADIICNFANADHQASAQAIVKGLAAHENSRPGYLIHTSGAGILLFSDIRADTYGEASDKVYDDLENVKEVTSLPDDASHRGVDKTVLEAGQSGSVRTAIVCPPNIYGMGRGPGNRRSIQVPELCRVTLERGYGVKVNGLTETVNAGKNFWGNVYIHDLSDLYLKLVESAAAGGSTAEWPGKPALWGAEGYFFCESGENAWGDVSQWIATEAYKHGLIDSDEVKSINKDGANECTRAGGRLWGANSRGRAKRARAALKWTPRGPSLREEIKSSLDVEAKRLGLKPGHAKVAAGEA